MAKLITRRRLILVVGGVTLFSSMRYGHAHLARPGRRRLRYIEDLHLANSSSHRSKHGNNLEDLVNWLNGPSTNGGHKHRRRI